MEIPDSLKKNHAVILSDNPQLAYARLAAELEQMQAQEDKKYRYIISDGAYISETAVIGERAYIEPGCVIGLLVAIGDDAVLLNGAVVRNAVIGDRILVNEYAVVDANGFTIVEDEKRNRMRVPSLGRVAAGNDVEVGVHDNVSRGSSGDTVLEDYVKLDGFVHIGHDACLKKNAEVAGWGSCGRI